MIEIPMKKDEKKQTKPKLSFKERISKKNQAIINKVNLWQNFKFAKPLTCKKEGCGTKVVPQERGQRVVLKCPKCNSVQLYVPRRIIEVDFSAPAALQRNKSRYYTTDL